MSSCKLPASRPSLSRLSGKLVRSFRFHASCQRARNSLSLFNSLVIFFIAVSAQPALSAESVPLLQDTRFERGVQVMANTRDLYTLKAMDEGRLVPAGKGATDQAFAAPLWRLNQWYNRYSILEALPVRLEQGGTRWELVKTTEARPVFFKSVTLAPGNPEAGDLVLALNALPEFEYEQSVSGRRYLESLAQPWPHLLVAQDLHSERLSQYRQLHFALDARLLQHDAQRAPGYRENLHAARFVVGIAVRNTFSQKQFWLMLPIYDNRQAFSGYGCRKCLPSDEGQEESCYFPETLDAPGRWMCPTDGDNQRQDERRQATRSSLFRVATRALTDDNIHNGDWVHFETDLLPIIEAAIAAVRQSDNTTGFSPGLNRYRLVLFTMGWEITGLDLAAVQVKNLRLEAVPVQKHPGPKFLFYR